MDFVIYSESGPGGGLQLDPQSIQTSARLSVAEVFALLISVAAMRAAQNPAVFGFGRCRSGQDREILAPRRKCATCAVFLQCLHIGQLSPKQDLSDLGKIDPTLLPAFENAFLEQCLMRFQYRDAKGGQVQS